LIQAKWFCDVVVCTGLKALKLIFHHSLGTQKNNGDMLIFLANTSCQGETILFRKHNIENAEVKRIEIKASLSFFTVGTQCNIVALDVEIVFDNKPKAWIIFY